MTGRSSLNSPRIDDGLRRRLLRFARKYRPGSEAEDAVQETLLATSTRGAHWHQGRVVLELMNQVRRIRRRAATRAHLTVSMEEKAE
jgi:DNA-directed RNA polymerase specialized sigma24 family protein